MVRYWSMPVLIKCLKAKWEFQISKSLRTFDVHAHPNLTVLLKWDDSRDNLNLNYTLCTVVGTIWCDKHAGTVTAVRLRNKSERLYFQFGSFKCWVPSDAGCSFTFLAFVCLCPVPFNSVCISLFPPSVNERYTCLWKCTPCNFLSFSWLYALTVLTHKTKYVGLQFFAPAPRHYAQHTYKRTCNDTYSCPAGRCQAPGRGKPRTSLPRCFFGERVECQRQAQGVGLHRAARARPTGGHGGIM